MARVIAGMTVSLDGFVNDRDGSVGRLYPDMAELRQREAMQRQIRATGAVVMGRRTYDMGDDYTDYEFQVPIFVITHRPPERVAKGANGHLSFAFVTEGIEHAVARAKAAADGRAVTIVGGPETIRQCLLAGLVDELEIDVRPVFLGDGLRLFDGMGDAPVGLEPIDVGASSGVVHLRFRVVR